MFSVGSDRMIKTSVVSKSGVYYEYIYIVASRAGAAVTEVGQSGRYTGTGTSEGSVRSLRTWASIREWIT